MVPSERAITGTPTGHEKSSRPVYITDEIISDWVARNVYRVAYAPETWTIDEPKTKDLRAAERGSRSIACSESL